MHSTLDVNNYKKMMAEKILEEIEYPPENLQNLFFAFSKMKVDDGLKEQEFSTIINTQHHQVVNIKCAVHAK
ncbi:hypothetical protein [Acinetobacter baumannii]|nr:hypothetical protein [Acinetobacter baumannii]AVI33978.1 hypothetical protein CSB70_3136 [Acinetobacter baumannii]EHU1236871.1 hypothetical protein [Acinetobacter baumannii]EHU1449044.1 hypothetical protein [Acinetobacter baumannii]EHU1568558.1 hypothetical protein [Acinetobacter baumannii]EHU1625675.1 hypothetical protein [Acinetobacter baumannii]